MNKTKKYKISFLILLFLAAFTFYVIFTKFSFYDIIDKVRESSHKHYLLFACVLSVVYIALYGRFINVGISALNEKTSRLKCFVYGCADFFYSAITPSASGGQPVVIYLMTKDGISLSTSAITVIFQTIAFKAVLLFYGILSLFVVWNIVSITSVLFLILILVGVATALISITLCIVSMYRPYLTEKVGTAILRFLTKLRIIRNGKERICSFKDTLTEYHKAATFLNNKKRVLLRMFFITLCQRTAMFSIAYFVYRSFGLCSFGYIDFLCVQALVSLAIDSVPLPGSMGANEYATYFLYGVVYGSNDVMAATAMLLTRGFSFYFPLVFTSILILGKQLLDHFKIRTNRA
ncbi:MAG: lysylphosphatidylglycerol synthase transmembrane domain-containing protein [Eubacteriales bacterium]|nr:lysylphosphatidylglycerol synthase transmembrane domain-containing protein [Eubacteriales bacterium]MDD4422114.1 lysylphosphatidylglycerol synthase transmembrane domain-containing protein [Eubacteriales bacterium]HBR32720.1 hypothetical protein [Clostridiales bacterium]